MNSKHMMTMACAVALCGSVLADTNETVNAEVAAGWNWAMGEGVAFEGTPIVSAEVSLAFDSKFLSYGLVDNNDPILTPSAALTFLTVLRLASSRSLTSRIMGRTRGTETEPGGIRK